MNFGNRPLVRLSAAALLVGGVVAGIPAPAYAADTTGDLAIDTVVGTKVAAGVEYKAAYAKIKNLGPGTPRYANIVVDASQVDPEKVLVEPFTGGPCVFDNEGVNPKAYSCLIDDREDIPAPGGSIEVPIFLFKPKPGVELPYSAKIGVKIETTDDTNADNNETTATIELTDQSGVDLGIVVPDVRRKVDWTMDPDQAAKAPLLVPGAETQVLAGIVNQGDAIADGVDLRIALPKGVTFTSDLRECTFSADRRTAECHSPGLQLQPEEILLGVFPVKVATDVKAPVTLAGGSATIKALGELPATAASLAKRDSALPGYLRKLSTKEATAEVGDLDESDNTDEYAVVVAAGGAAGGAGEDEGGAGGGAGDDGGLPVTGAKAGLLGGVGLAVLAAGGAMFLVARRRRVVLVTPGDEKSTD